jgi:metallophosphoesterase (TIGR03767 family)
VNELPVSRRTILKVGGFGALAAATGAAALFGDAAAAAASDPAFTWLTPTGTTLDQTVLKDTPGAGGYATLMSGAGEPYTVRTIAITPSPLSYAIAAFVQITDMQIVDDQSPGRVEFTDRWADPPLPFNKATDAAYRPQEFLSTHIVEAMTRAIRNVGRGPKTGLPLAFTIATGDMVDNVQYNETRWYIDLLDGGHTIRPDSGQLGLEQSVSYLFAFDDLTPAAVFHESPYWSPDGRTDNFNRVDNYRSKYGFPVVPGLLAAARLPYTSTGLGMPWYAVMGNHDGEIQGNYPVHPTTLESVKIPDISGHATSGDKAFTSGAAFSASPSPEDVALFMDNLQYRPVVADNNRRFLTNNEFAKEHWTTTGLPLGHGFGHISLGLGPDLYPTYYTIPSGDSDLIQYIALDTVNYDGNSNGRIDGDQFKWLEAQLKANSSRYIAVDNTIVTQPGVKDKLLVIFSHHTIQTINNDSTNLVDIGEADFIYGGTLEWLLLRYPNVVLMVAGHTHSNVIVSHARGSEVTGYGNHVLGVGGFWEVSTASHIDWPSQSRIIELAGNGAEVSIFTSIVDIAAPLKSGGDVSSPTTLASMARELAANDPTERPLGRSGHPLDRNTRLVVPAPFPLPNPGQPVGPWFFQANTSRPSGDFLWQLGQDGAGRRSSNGLTMQPGSSPSVALRMTGEYKVAFHCEGSPHGLLWVLDQTGVGHQVTPSLGPAPGTSPSIAALAGGGYQMALHGADTNLLWLVAPSEAGTSTGHKMTPGASPSIAASPLGGYLVAFQDDAGFVCQLDHTGAFRRCGNGLGVMAGTNPSVVAFPTGGYLIAFQGGDGNLWTVTEKGTQKNTLIKLAAGSGPSIAASMNGFVVAYKAADGFLWQIGPDGVPQRSGNGLGVAANTSPSIYAYPGGTGFEIAFQGGDDFLWKIDHNGGFGNTQLGMRPGTSPCTSYAVPVSTANGPPHATSPGAQSSNVGVAVNLALSATGGIQPYAWAASGLPAGLSMNPATGAITGTIPLDANAGAYSVVVTLTDAFHQSTSTTFTWTVSEPLVTVPNVIALSKASAVSRLRSAGFDVSTGTINNCLDPGTVQDQSPAGGRTAQMGSTVDITVSTCTGGGDPK